MVVIYNLSTEDKKALSALERAPRQQASKLAREAGLQRHVLEYHLKRLEEKGIIRGHYSVLDPSLLGLTTWEVWVSLRPRHSKREFLTHIEDHPLVWWHNECEGAYDAVACILCRNPQEITGFLAEVEGRFPRLIRDTAVLLTTGFEHHTRGYLAPPSERLGGTGGAARARLGKSQRLVLGALALNARTSLSSIAQATGLNVKTVREALHDLTSSGVIACFKTALDVERLGMESYRILLHLRNPHGGGHEHAMAWCRRHPRITSVLRHIGQWQIEVEAEVASYRELSGIIRELREVMDIRRHEVLLITNARADLRMPPALDAA